jgi:hypothetical protein
MSMARPFQSFCLQEALVERTKFFDFGFKLLDPLWDRAQLHHLISDI